MEVGHTIANLRIKAKLTQRSFAAALNVSPGVIGLWETNKRLPSFEGIISLADFFCISTDVLFEKDRKLKSEQYNKSIPQNANSNILLDTFSALNEDNQYILIGEAKKMLKNQRLEEKRENATLSPQPRQNNPFSIL